MIKDNPHRNSEDYFLSKLTFSIHIFSQIDIIKINCIKTGDNKWQDVRI